jgi:hypothetical protein
MELLGEIRKQTIRGRYSIWQNMVPYGYRIIALLRQLRGPESTLYEQ